MERSEKSVSPYSSFLLGCLIGILVTLLIEIVIQANRDTGIQIVEKPPELFGTVRQKVGCEFISDLPYHPKMVKKVLRQMDLEKYTTLDLQDLFWYVFKVHLHSKKDMIEFLKKEE